MPEYTDDETAARSGTTVEFVRRMAAAGLIGNNARFSDTDIRRLQVLQQMERAGLPLEEPEKAFLNKGARGPA
jgi:DNA-binding transcriptional MerR regulator